MIGFYYGSSLPATESLKSGIYFIVNEGKGQLYRVRADATDAVLVAETTNASLIADVEQAKKDIQANATSVGSALASIKTITDSYGKTLKNITDEVSTIRTIANNAQEQATINETDIATANRKITANENAISTIEADYLKKEDKTELSGVINSKANQTALDAVSRVANAAATKTALEAEVTRAKGEEEALDERLVEVEAFFKLAEGEQLDTAFDTLVEIQNYLDTEGEVANKMLQDIADNAAAIKAADDKAVAAQNKANANATEIAKKAAQADLKALKDRVEANEGSITSINTALDGEDGVKAKLTAVDIKATNNATAIGTNTSNIEALMTALEWKQLNLKNI